MKTSSKRFINSLLALTLSTALVTPSYVNAATTTIKSTDSAGKTESYVTSLTDSYTLSVYANITGEEVISADISWGSLVYTYSTSGWDASTLTSTGTPGWKPQEADVSDVITVDNRSNVNLTASFAYASASVAGYTAVTGTFTQDSLTLLTANSASTVTEDQRKKSTKLSLSGAPVKENIVSPDTNTQIGSVIITLAKTE